MSSTSFIAAAVLVSAGLLGKARGRPLSSLEVTLAGCALLGFIVATIIHQSIQSGV
jgi:hypothetical protein